MKRMVRIRIVALITAIVLMLPAGLSLADSGAEPTSPATLSDDHRGANGAYTGAVTLNAPAGYGVSFAPDGEFGAAVTYSPAGDGSGYIAYYLRADGADSAFGPYYQAYTYDATPPAANAAAYASDSAQQLVLSFSEPVLAVAESQISIRQGEAVYRAAPAAGGAAPRYALELSRFVDEGGNALSPDISAQSSVTIPAGAFTDAAGNACAQTELTVPAGDGSARVLHNLNESMGWTLVAAIDGAEIALESGAAIPVHTTIKAVAAGRIANPCTFAVYSNGQPVHGVNPTAGYAVPANAEIYAQTAALAGTAAIRGTAEYGQTLTASFAPANGAAPSGLNYAWSRGGMVLSAGTGASAYTPGKGDIGKVITLSITSPWCTGDASASGVSIKKTSVAAPPAPTAAEQTDTAVRLNETAGCEYRLGDGAWQDSAAFTGLAQGQAHTFYQRYKETETTQASPASPGLTAGMAAGLTGTVRIEGDVRVKSTVSARVTDSNNTGELRYEWKRDAARISDTQTYTIQPEDLGKTLTVEVSSSVQNGTIGATSPVVGKAAVAAPPAPSLASNTNGTITLNAVSGCEYSLGGTSWQDAATFHNLTAGQTYPFYQRYKETAAAQASPMSAPAMLSTVSALSGAIRVDGDVRYGKTLVASFTGSGHTGTLTYIWYRGSVTVGTGQTYDVNAADINNPIYVRVVGSMDGGSVTQLAGVAKRAVYVGRTPDAPTRASRSTSKISLTAVDGCEYSRDGSNWQSSAVFTGLKAGTTYKFYQRVKATATIEASPASAALTTSTSSSGSSSGGGSGSGGGSDDEGGNGGSATTTPSGTALYSYTLTGDNTRILFSTMESLITGNRTQDVTIRSKDAEYSFAKGTMQLTAGTLWYDFGVKIDDCTHRQAAQQAAGDHFVSLVHFNMEGNLPAKASIRLSLGAAQAGKTLYYYKFTPNTGTLSFMQTAVADASGWVTVEQSSCSDYVFLDADINALAATTPSPLPSEPTQVSPSPTALISEPAGNGGGFGGWLILLIIVVALLLIVIGIIMFVKSRNERGSLFDDEDDLYGEGYDGAYDEDAYHESGYDDAYGEADADDYDAYGEFDDSGEYDANELPPRGRR